MEVYLSKYQKYYTFEIKSRVMTKYFNKNNNNNNKKNNGLNGIEEEINYFIRLIKIKIN
jgi:hypothetical protein